MPEEHELLDKNKIDVSKDEFGDLKMKRVET